MDLNTIEDIHNELLIFVEQALDEIFGVYDLNVPAFKDKYLNFFTAKSEFLIDVAKFVAQKSKIFLDAKKSQDCEHNDKLDKRISDMQE